MPNVKIKKESNFGGREIPKAPLKMKCTGSGDRYKSDGSSKSDNASTYSGNIKK